MKNKFILSLVLGIFLVGLVSAGITGYLFRGDLVPGTSAQIESVGSNSIVVDGENVGTGETFTRGSTTYEVVAVEKPSWFLGRPKVAIQEVTSSVAVSQTATDCEENCQAFTERYKLDEGKTITLQGNQISIDFIDASNVKFEINGQPTELFSKNQWFELSNNQIIEVEKITKLEVGGTIGHTILGLKGYKLDEGETITLQGNQISIDFVDANNVKLDVNGQITDFLNEGNWIELSNGQIVVVEDITKLEVGGTIGYVRLSPASCYFPYL